MADVRGELLDKAGPELFEREVRVLNFGVDQDRISAFLKFGAPDLFVERVV